MLERLFPRPVDNRYEGYKAALWLLGLVTAVTIFQGVAVIVNGYSTLMSADGIPLDTFPEAPAQTVVALWAQRGLYRIILCLLAALALVRYRSAVPFMFALLVVNYLASQLVFMFLPVVRVGSPPGPWVNFAMFVLTVVGLVLSLMRPRTPSA
jgi:hypothetical protein